MVEITRGATKKPISSEQLAKIFAQQKGLQGELYIGYPIIATPEGPFPVDAIFISPDHDVILFDLVEGRDLGAFEDRQDDAYNKLESKLRQHKSLMRRRDLAISIVPVTFAPSCSNVHSNEDYIVCDEQGVFDFIKDLENGIEGFYEPLLAVLQSISTIRKGTKKREATKPDSKGSKLQALENSIANLDNVQGKAVIETIDGVQRIRGLAGSGKTIVLALKAAYLHAQHPEWKIAVSFQTRSLKGQLKRLINTFVIEQTNEEPDWDNLQILHAWGAPGGKEKDGLYYSFCKDHGIPYMDFSAACNAFGQNSAFEGACGKALEAIPNPKSTYDAILIDEAQDFPPGFLCMCYDILKEPKRLVYAYDELQNLSNRSLPPPEEIFGDKANGKPKVQFNEPEAGQPKQDVILEKCYRNSRPVLSTAHALGFGIYRKPVVHRARDGADSNLVQMFDHKHLWTEVGYKVVEGKLEEGEHVKLARTSQSSPPFLEAHSTVDDLIQFKRFNSVEEQNQWLAEQIEQNLQQDELRADDIIVINPDPFKTRKNVGPVRRMLFDKKIKTHLAGVDTSPDIFFNLKEESVTFTGIYRAKGNEAGMVYIINAHDCYLHQVGSATRRNQLFTAITRSKAWVRVLGVGEGMKALIKEYEQVRDNEFALAFTYPTAEQRRKLNVINRDMTQAEKNARNRQNNYVTQLANGLESGEVQLEDLDEEHLARLQQLLANRK